MIRPPRSSCRSVRRPFALVCAATIVTAMLLSVWVLSAAAAPFVGAPAVDSESVVGITPFDAQLQARISPEGQATEWYFEYSTSNTMSGATIVGSGTLPGAYEGQTAGPVDIDKAIGGALMPDTIYFYRVIAANATGAVEGPVQEFTTLALEKPGVETGNASGAVTDTITGATEARLTGSVDPDFQRVTGCEFQYATEAATLNSSPSAIPCAQALGELGEGSSPVAVSAVVTGLAANTTYFYRLVATNDTGSAEGAVQHFAITPPVLTGAGVSPLTSSGAVVAATVDTVGLPARWELRLGRSPATLQSQAAGNASSPEPEQVAIPLENLLPGTTYYYALTLTSPDGVAESGVLVFATTAATPPAAQAGAQGPSFPSLSVLPSVFPAETPVSSPKTPAVRKLTIKQKLQKALTACRKKRNKHKRTLCEHKAHRTYKTGK